MKRSFFGLGIVLALLLTASALCAAPAPSSALPAFLAPPANTVAASPLAAALSGETTSLPATPMQTGCGPIRYFCQACSTAATDQRLCSEQICGTFVILNCGDCSPRCVLPPG
jgi:hypothetical protein